MEERSRHDAPLGRPRTISIHRALTRSVLLGGADRELVLANGVIVGALIFGIGLSWYTVSVSASLLVIGHWGLVVLAKRDPDIRRVYVRHVQLASFYPGAPPVQRQAALVQPSVTVSE